MTTLLKLVLLYLLMALEQQMDSVMMMASMMSVKLVEVAEAAFTYVKHHKAV